jgi:predicted phosphate transport protein (TIGR00153 family)
MKQGGTYMAKRQANVYYDGFIELVEYACRASRVLDKILRDFNIDNIKDNIDEMHSIEHSADMHKHTLMEKLAREFITPIEREDIMMIVQKIDDVTDAIEDVLLQVYMYNIRTILQGATEFSEIIVKCCEMTKNVLDDFKNFRKSKTIHEHIVFINDLEEQGDRIFVHSVHSLYQTSNNPVEIIAWTSIFNSLEHCCDVCEEVSESIETIMMKNS